MLIGYARVLTIDQNPALQMDALKDTENYGNYPFIGDVIDQLKIGRTAFYRYFPTDRIKQLRNEHETNLQTTLLHEHR